MRKLIGALGLAMAALLSACGGGGGSPGQTQEQYSITLRADKTSLPTNISLLPPGMGVYAPYTTTLYVNAKAGNDAIPPGTDIFSCNLEGLSSGALYYLDGDPNHEDADGNPKGSRTVILPANAGGSSFHFHAGNQAGTGHVTCSVVDPRDNRVYSASVDIKVGSATGMPGSIEMVTQDPNPLGTQGNLSNSRTSVALQAYVWDDLNQPVPNSSAVNLQVSISTSSDCRSSSSTSIGPWTGARLLSGTASGSIIRVKTVNGVAQFALSSGQNAGVICLEMVADRYDNNVDPNNGIQDPVRQVYLVNVKDVPDAAGQTPLAFPSPPAITVTNGVPMGYPLLATDGVPPYTWAALDPLPTGLSLDAQSGIISGTPLITAGTYVARVRVTDDAKESVTAPVTIVVQGLIKPALVISDAAISATVGVPFSYALSATGGRPPLTWTAATPLPAGLTLAGDGVLSGTLGAEGSYMIAVKVTDSDGTSSNGNISVKAVAAVPPSP